MIDHSVGAKTLHQQHTQWCQQSTSEDIEFQTCNGLCSKHGCAEDLVTRTVHEWNISSLSLVENCLNSFSVIDYTRNMYNGTL